MSFSMTSGWNASATDKALAGIAFLVMVTVWPGISGFAIAPRWAVLATLPPLLLFAVRIRMTPLHWLGLALMAYATASLLWAPVFVEALQGWAQMVILAVAFCLGGEAEDMRPFYAASALGVSVSAILAVLQIAGFDPVEQIVSPAGLFANKNLMGETAGVALVGVMAAGLWPLAVMPALALALSTCWGAAFGVLMAGVAWVWTRSAWYGIAAALVALTVAQLVFVNMEGRRYTVTVRARIVADAVGNMRWFGHGVGSYWVATPQNAPRQEAMNVRHWHAHNDPLEMAFNFGLGSILFFALVGALLSGPVCAEWFVLIAVLGTGLFGFPLFAPATGFVAAVCAGRLARRRADLRDPVVDRSEYSGFWDAGPWPVRDQTFLAATRGEAVSAGSFPARAAGAGRIGV